MTQRGSTNKTHLRHRLINGILIKEHSSHHLLGTILLSAVLLTVLTFGFILCHNAIRLQDTILGLKLNGHIVGNLSSSDLRTEINTLLDARENITMPVKVAESDTYSTVTLRQLGERANRDMVYSQIISTGRSGSIVSQISTQQLAAMGAVDISLNHPHLDINRTQKYIADLAKKTDVPAQNARFILENDRILVRPHTSGKAIDMGGSIDEILNAKPEYGSLVTLPVRYILPSVNTETLQLLLPLARTVADRPLTIKAAGSTMTLTRDQLVQSLTVKPPQKTNLSQEQKLPQLVYNDTVLASAIDEFIKKVSAEPVPTLMSGGTVVRQGTPGLAAKDARPVEHIIKALQARQQSGNKISTITIPMKPVAPPIVQNANSDLLTRTGTGVVHLTFDDGPGAYTDQVLDILKRYKVHATFYIVGRNVPGNVYTMQRMRDEGHKIGNHSYNHADLSRLSYGAVAQELASTQTAIQQAIGMAPTAFRPPYGALNPLVREVAASLGLSVDMWTIDANDWAQPGTNEIVRTVLGNDRANSVVLLHILHKQTVEALPAIIEGIRTQGYTLE